MGNKRKQLTWAAIGSTILIVAIQVIGELAKMAISGDLPTPPPTRDVVADMQTAQAIQTTNDAILAQTLGRTPAPAGNLETLFAQQAQAATPNAETLLTFCHNISTATPNPTPDNCQAWVDQTMKAFPAEVAACQSAIGDFPTCLRERGVLLP